MTSLTRTPAARSGSEYLEYVEYFRRRFMYARRRLVHVFLRRATLMARSLWQAAPLATKPLADRDTYLRLYEAARSAAYPDIDQYERETGFVIDRPFVDDLALHTQVVVKDSPLMWPHGRLLYSSLRDYLRKHPTERVTILETGTARGFSALCMAKALQDVDQPGVIITIDIIPHEQDIYWNCIDDLDGKKSRRELLKPWHDLASRFVVFIWGDSRSILPALSVDRIHFAFIDGAHTYGDVMFEFRHVAAKQEPGDVIVFDDVNEEKFPGIFKAVQEICTNRGYKRLDISSGGARHYVIAERSA